MLKLKLITLLRLDFARRRIKERISSIVWRFLLFDALVYGFVTPLIYFIGYFLFPEGTINPKVAIMMCIVSPTILICMFTIFHVLDSTYNSIATKRSMAMYMFHNWKLKMGWGRFCVVRKKSEGPEGHYRVGEMRKHKKVHYDDPQKAALEIWVNGFTHAANDLNQIFTLLIRGRAYDLPKLNPVSVEAIKDHIEHCLEIDESFYG